MNQICDGMCACGTWTKENIPPWHTCAVWSERVFSSPLDPGIARAVHLLRDNGVETYESCQGGEGHSSPYPVVRFHGKQYEGFRALSVALMYGLPVYALHRVWMVVDGEPSGPSWELEFRCQLPPPTTERIKALEEVAKAARLFDDLCMDRGLEECNLSHDLALAATNLHDLLIAVQAVKE